MSGRNFPKRRAKSISMRSQPAPFMAKRRSRRQRSSTRRGCPSFPCHRCRRIKTDGRGPVNLSLGSPCYSLDALLCDYCRAWLRAKPGNTMRLSSLLLPKHAFGLFVFATLAFALASPSGAETRSKPPSAETEPNAAAPSEPHAAEAASESPGKAGSQILINIDKSHQQMTVFVDGIEKYTWPVSTGRYGYSTPSGTFTPTS